MNVWIIDENEDEDNYLQVNNDKIQVGDTLEVMTNNQLGYKKYKVGLDVKGEKILNLIADWYIELYEYSNKSN